MRLIDADTLIEAFDPDHYFDWYTPNIIETINEQPSVEPARGKWIAKTKNQGGYIVSITCSVCGYAHSRVTYNFCPECGADMRKAGGNNV